MESLGEKRKMDRKKDLQDNYIDLSKIVQDSNSPNNTKTLKVMHLKRGKKEEKERKNKYFTDALISKTVENKQTASKKRTPAHNSGSESWKKVQFV